MDQQPDMNEHREVREILLEILKSQEQILRRLELLEQRMSSAVRD